MAKGKALHYLFLTIFGFIWIFPLLALLLFSFAPNTDIVQNRLFPSVFTLDNYVRVLSTELRGVNVPRSLINSTIVLVIQVIGVLALDAPAAYALARLKFRGREAIFWIILVTMMMPGHIILISLYEMMSRASLVDTLPGVILPGLPRVIGIFLLRQFFRGIPKEFEEAAIVDGATNWQVFSRIMLPLAVPALATLTIITTLYSWNNFLWPLIVINTSQSMTAPIAIAYLNSGTNPVQNYSVLLAASILVSAPMLIVFIIGQRWIVRGLAPAAGIK